MLLNKQVKEITTYNIFLDNTITTRESENGALKNFRLDYKETLVRLDGAITINLYQYQDIYLNKTNYYLINDFINKDYKLFKEME